MGPNSPDLKPFDKDLWYGGNLNNGLGKMYQT